MKKLIPIAVIAVFGTLTMLSCKKSSSTGNYTCTCTFKWISGDTTIASTFPNISKSTAQTDCDSFQKLWRNTGDSTATCTLK